MDAALKVLNFFFLAIFLVACSRNYAGIYSECWGVNPTHEQCNYLVLKKDRTFEFHLPDCISPKTTYGLWNVQSDSLILNSCPPFHLITASKQQNSDTKTFQIRRTAGEDFHLMESAKLLLDDSSVVMVADGIGVTSRKSIDSVYIMDGVGCQVGWIKLSPDIKLSDSITIDCNLIAINQFPMTNQMFSIKNDTIKCRWGEKSEGSVFLVKRDRR